MRYVGETNYGAIAQGAFQWLAAITAGVLLGDTVAHSIGIIFAIYAVMPVAR